MCVLGSFGFSSDKARHILMAHSNLSDCDGYSNVTVIKIMVSCF